MVNIWIQHDKFNVSHPSIYTPVWIIVYPRYIIFHSAHRPWHIGGTAKIRRKTKEHIYEISAPFPITQTCDHRFHLLPDLQIMIWMNKNIQQVENTYPHKKSYNYADFRRFLGNRNCWAETEIKTIDSFFNTWSKRITIHFETNEIFPQWQFTK